MCRFLKSSLLVILFVTFFSTTAYAAKVEICHNPPDEPGNFHEITISENALQRHLEHGDFLGSCVENCAALCDDDNACTIDYLVYAGGCICLLGERPPVDCDDENTCTLDLCNSAEGCTYISLANGTPCEDNDPETEYSVCTDGVCTVPTGCPCMEMIMFADFVNNIEPVYCFDNDDNVSLQDTLFYVGKMIGASCSDGICFYSDSQGTESYEITPAEVEDCNELLRQVAADADLVCSDEFPGPCSNPPYCYP